MIKKRKTDSMIFSILILIMLIIFILIFNLRYFYLAKYKETLKPLPLPKGFQPGDEYKSVENITGEDFFNKSELYNLQILGTVGQDKAVLNLYSEVDKVNNKITLYFEGTNVGIYKRKYNETTWTSIGIKTSPFIDTNIVLGEIYEYKLVNSLGGTGYIYSGIEIPLTEYRGSLVLLIDDKHINPLKDELRTLEKDLIGDGWKVIRHDVSRSSNTSSIKELIRADYINNQDLKGIFILGHVPIPYSGYLNPDGHMDHAGAWASDMFYADVTNDIWTDNSINSIGATRPENWNIPGDGKYDTTCVDGLGFCSNKLELFVSRVDLYNMPSFSKNETELLRQYLNKSHNFKNAILKVSKRALLEDNFLGYAEGFSQSGWRLSGLVGKNNVSAVDFSELVNNDYLWAYGCGPGTYTSAGGIASTSSFSSSTYKGIFYMLFGSYFGDWDSTDNFLKSPLANPDYGLTNAWAGRPNWYFQRMGIGEPIGYSFLDSYKSSSTLYTDGGNKGYVHISLLGDPTLRMDYISPVKNLKSVVSLNKVNLTWNASNDSIIGYQVFYSESYNNTFNKIPNIITNNYFIDDYRGDGIYMVKAIALTTGSSGSYFNPSIGIFSEVQNLCLNDNDCSYLDNNCKIGKCSVTNGSCYIEDSVDGVICNDMNSCTINDKCFSGICTGQSINCSYLDSSCNKGACQNGICIETPFNEGSVCEDNLYCSINNICLSGLCSQGNSRDCDDNNVTTYDYCNETSDSCQHYLIIFDNDHDGVPDNNDLCPSTTPEFIDNVNFEGCPKPIANKFDILSNFNISSLFNYSGLTIGNSSYLMINFLENISLLRFNTTTYFPTDLDSNINISLRKISINPDLIELNKRAKLIFYNVNFSNYEILKNNLNCTNCFVEYFNKTQGLLIFNSAGTHDYEIIENLFCGDNLCNNNENCNNCPADCGVCTTSANNNANSNSQSTGYIPKINKTANCTSNWSCTEYGSCNNNVEARVCKDLNNCTNQISKPIETQNCTIKINGSQENIIETPIENNSYLLEIIMIITLIMVIIIIIFIITRIIYVQKSIKRKQESIKYLQNT